MECTTSPDLRLCRYLIILKEEKGGGEPQLCAHPAFSEVKIKIEPSPNTLCFNESSQPIFTTTHPSPLHLNLGNHQANCTQMHYLKGSREVLIASQENGAGQTGQASCAVWGCARKTPLQRAGSVS